MYIHTRLLINVHDRVRKDKKGNNVVKQLHVWNDDHSGAVDSSTGSIGRSIDRLIVFVTPEHVHACMERGGLQKRHCRLNTTPPSFFRPSTTSQTLSLSHSATTRHICTVSSSKNFKSFPIAKRGKREKGREHLIIITSLMFSTEMLL